MPSKLEQELLALAAEQGRQNQAGVEAPVPNLPPLEPGSLLSATALGELQAARDIRAREAQAREALADPWSSLLPRHRTVEAAQVEIQRPEVREVPFEMSVSRAELEAADDGISVSALASLFMNNEAHAQADLMGIAHIEDHSEPMASEMDIEFDSDFGGGAAPNEAVRFRVGQEDPPPSSFYRGPAVNTDGRVVSQIGDDGRFHRVDEGIQPLAPPAARAAPVSPARTYPTAAPSPTANNSQRPSASPEDRSHYPTVHDVIAGDDFLPDD